MIIINVIYKTNRYKFALFIIINVNALENSFYIDFCFLIIEIKENYLWTLMQYKKMMFELNIRDSIINIIDREKALIKVCNIIFLFF